MGNWWFDEEPWPGPKEQPPVTLEDYKRVFVHIGRAFGKIMVECSDNLHTTFDSLVKAYDPKPIATPPTTREELLERKKQNKHGPYGGGFDRRGRKF